MKYLFLPLIFMVWGISPAKGIPAEPGIPLPADSGIAFSIRYYDKRVYYLEQDPVLVQVTLTNNSPSTFRFKLADERVFSVDFDVRTTANRAVEAADFLVRRRSENRQIYFREISVETGESFSFVENLRNYAALNNSGSYVVSARIFPELYHAQNTAAASAEPLPQAGTPPAVIQSNRLPLTIRPRPLPGPDGIAPNLDVETNAILVREKLSPDEVISYLLTARQKSQWEKYFLYLDLEAMLARDGIKQRQWNAESEEGRIRMVNRYREELMRGDADGASLIPLNFIIERTVYTQDSGVVSVLENFREGDYIVNKRYTWYLEKQDDIWMVVDYTVAQLGTE